MVKPRIEMRDAAVGGAPALAVSGEIDLASAPELSERLEEAILDTEGVFVIDLCDLRFIDSSGIQMLLRAMALLGREDRRLALVCPTGAVRRALELAGVGDVFVLYETRRDAAQAFVSVDD